MQQVCPSCHGQRLSSQNPYGMMVCLECGWLGQDIARERTWRELSLSAVRWLSSVGLLGLLLVMSVQLAIWKSYSFEATLLSVRYIFGDRSASVFLDRGAICNSLQKWDCAVEAFTDLVEREPNHRTALANLAIALTQSGRWSESIPHYNAYFSLGGDAYDVVYWYGRLQALRGKPDMAIDWYYYALARNPSYSEAILSLLGELERSLRWEEALSLLGSVQSEPVSRSPEFLELKDRIEEKQKQAKGGPRRIRSASWNGNPPLIPVRLMPEGRVHQFALVGPGEPISLNRDLLDENLIAQGEVRESRRVLSFFKVGPWVLSDIPVQICDDCPNLLGRAQLASFVFNTVAKNGVEFLEYGPTDDREEFIVERMPSAQSMERENPTADQNGIEEFNDDHSE